MAATRGAHMPAALTTMLAADRAVVGDDPLHLALGRELNAGDAHAGVHRHAHLRGKADHAGGGACTDPGARRAAGRWRHTGSPR